MTDDPAGGILAIRPLAESGLLVEFANAIDPAVVDRVMALAAAIEAGRPPGLHDVVPSYRTILLAFDPALTDGDTLGELVRRLAAQPPKLDEAAGRTVTIPIVYGGEFGPDLAVVAAHTGLSSEAICELHAAATYRVACMGFAPGFGFLVGLPTELATPRRATPRTRVPAGSVAIGGAQTGVYPDDLPGGWNIIGRTPLRMFDVARAKPFLIEPGDTVRFEAVSMEAYEAQLAASYEQAPMEVAE
jgi:KipI family sensor histidine kinase inhibitor